MWNLDVNSNTVAKDFEFRSKYFEKHGVSYDQIDIPLGGSNELAPKKPRVIILTSLVLVSMIFGLKVFRGKKQK